jgi:hypothetical protein
VVSGPNLVLCFELGISNSTFILLSGGQNSCGVVGHDQDRYPDVSNRDWDCVIKIGGELTVEVAISRAIGGTTRKLP